MVIFQGGGLGTPFFPELWVCVDEDDDILTFRAWMGKNIPQKSTKRQARHTLRRWSLPFQRRNRL